MAAFLPSSLRLAQSSFLPSPLSSSANCRTASITKPPQCPAPPTSRSIVNANIFRNFASNIPPDDPTPTSDFRTMTTAAPFLPSFSALVLSAKRLTPKGEYVELIIDASEFGVHEKHTAPGQTLRLGNPNGKLNGSVVAVISSPPQSGPFLRFLIATSSDPCRLAQLRPGDTIVTGSVCGDGIDYSTAAAANGNLFLFIDAPQSYALLLSLVEWPTFRAITGTGANRTTKVTVFYYLPNASGIPYAHRFSDWCLYAVNIVPVMGSSILDFMSAQSSLSHTFLSAQSDYAISAVTLDQSFESLFSSLVLLGFRRSAISKFTEEDVAKQKNDYNQTRFDIPPPQSNRSEKANSGFDGIPEHVYAEHMRQEFERDIWQNWVRVREGMREEFEKKWAAESQIGRDRSRTEEEKRHAWASWAAHNESQWTEVKWDDQAWNDYWRTWHTTKDKGSDANANGADFFNGQQAWNQDGTQEYWDWIGRGAKAKRSPGGRRSNTSEQSYRNQYGGGSGSWGNSNNGQQSGYQKSGYRYEHDSQQDQGNQNQGSWSGWGNWGHWGNRSSSSSSSTSSSGGGRRANSDGAKLDLYSILGVSSRASRSEIKKAYRKKAMEHHPDRNPDRLEDAHRTMVKVVLAWSVLSQHEKRRKYDTYGDGGL